MRVALTRPILPDSEELKAGRPASGAATIALLAAPAYTLGALCARSGCADVRVDDWTQGLAAFDGVEVVHAAYRPGYLARLVTVYVWAAQGIGAVGVPLAELTVDLLDGAGLVVADETIALAPPVEGSAQDVPVQGVATPVADSGVMRAAERVYAVTLPAEAMGGLPGTIRVTATRAAVLCVAWVEQPTGQL